MVKMLGCIKSFMVGYRNGVRFDYILELRKITYINPVSIPYYAS